jgi:hypothetical protein
MLRERSDVEVRGVSHHGQEIDLHLKAGYIDADFPSSINFSLAFRRRTIHLTKFESPAHAFGADEILNTLPATNRVAA